jgi:hypothetical protein
MLGVNVRRPVATIQSRQGTGYWPLVQYMAQSVQKSMYKCSRRNTFMYIYVNKQGPWALLLHCQGKGLCPGHRSAPSRRTSPSFSARWSLEITEVTKKGNREVAPLPFLDYVRARRPYAHSCVSISTTGETTPGRFTATLRSPLRISTIAARIATDASTTRMLRGSEANSHPRNTATTGFA